MSTVTSRSGSDANAAGNSAPQSKRRRYVIAMAALLLGAAAVWFRWPEPDALDTGVIAPNATPAELVRFTATRNFTRLSVEDQMKYLMSWGMLPADVRSKTLAELSKEPYVLELSSTNSNQTMQLLHSRQFFAASKEERTKMLDQIIDAEMAMVKQIKGVMKQAEAQGGKFDAKVGDPKLRKLLLENTPPEVRVEISAFVQAKVERKKERGIGNEQQG